VTVIVVIVSVVRAIVVAVAVAVAVTAMVTVMLMLVLVLVIPACIPWVVFSRPNEIHGPITGVVLSAVLAPIFGVPRRYVQVDGRQRSYLRLDQHRLRIHQRWRTFIADLNLTVYSGRDLTG
jgi:hypothetical protein